MTVCAPDTKMTGSSLLLLLALFMLLPSEIWYCAVQAEDKSHDQGECIFFAKSSSMKVGTVLRQCGEKSVVLRDSTINLNVTTCLVVEQAEQNTVAVAQNIQQPLWPTFGEYHDTYEGLYFDGPSQFGWWFDIFVNLYCNFDCIVGSWLYCEPWTPMVLFSAFLVFWIVKPTVSNRP